MGNEQIEVNCFRCAGLGRYCWGICWACNGAKTVLVSKKKLNVIKRWAVANQSRMDANAAEQQAITDMINDAYHVARAIIAERGLPGARDLFVAYRNGPIENLYGLIAAMRDSGYTEESNGIVEWIRVHRADAQNK